MCRREGGREGEGRVGEGRGGEGACHNIEYVIFKWQDFFYGFTVLGNFVVICSS